MAKLKKVLCELHSSRPSDPVECVELLTPIFGGYFSSIVNHSFVPIPATPNTMYVFCSSYGIDFRSKKTIRITKPTFSQGMAFYDFEYSSSYGAAGRMDVISLYHKDCFLGYYESTNNIFICCDMSHSMADINLTRELSEDIIRALDLKPVSTSKKSPIVHPKVNLKDITVGCDPEFEVFQEGDIIEATELPIRDNNYDNEIGIDGAGSPIELRPKPGTPVEVANNLHKLINKFCKRFPNERLCVSGHVFPIGAHIHIGTKRHITNFYNLSKILDEFIGAKVLPLSGKARGGYKLLTQYREQKHGFEYRTPPSGAFYNKELTKILLKLARHIAYLYIKNSGKAIEFHSPPTREEYMEIGGISSKEYEYMKNLLPTIKSKLRGSSPVYAAWGINTSPIKEGAKKPIKIEFAYSDSWGGWRQREIESELNKWVASKIPLEKFGGIKKIIFHLFGYRKNRGTVTNIPGFYMVNEATVEALPKVFVRKIESTFQVNLGMPWDYRNNYEASLIKTEQIIKELTRLLKKEDLSFGY